MIATMTSKGQATFPKAVRQSLSLHSGDKLDFVLRDDGVMEVIPLKQPVLKLKGILPKPAKAVTIKQMNKAIEKGARGSFPENDSLR